MGREVTPNDLVVSIITGDDPQDLAGRREEYKAEVINRIGGWLSAALDDPKVCEEMKADIRDWLALAPHL